VSAGDYTIDVTIGAWSATIHKGDQTDPAATAVTMDPLTAAWSMAAGYPSQPNPTTVTFGLYVPDVATGPTPTQGTRVELTITTPDHDPALTEIRPVLEFVGLITDVDATPLVDGLAFNITAADYTSTLGEARIGDQPWPAEWVPERLDRVVIAAANIGVPLVVLPAEQAQIDAAGDYMGPSVAARDVDSQPVRAILDELLAAAVIWLGIAPEFWISGSFGWAEPSLTTWVRPIVGQHDTGGGNIVFPIMFIPGGLPDADAALPYRLALVSGTLQLQRKAIAPDTSLVAWIPAAAVESDSVTWRQDKATNTNRVRAVGPDLVDMTDTHTGSVAVEFSDLVDQNGPNETTVNVPAPQISAIKTIELLYAILGTHYDASPRWAVDTFTIRAAEIPNGDQWPRLFSPREHTHIYDQAAGKLVLITDPATKWSLHDRADYWGRLAGASFSLAGGKITWTATLAHRLPVGAGLESITDGPLYAAQPNYTGPPTHHPITYAELAAGTNPTVAQSGDLTCADLELVEG
jgi:hypothetical protein